MAKKRSKKPKQAASSAPAKKQTEERTEKSIPQFEMGVKGDDFDRAYTRAAKEATADTDRLLYTLSRESRADKFNLLELLIPFIIILFASLTFAVLSRGELEDIFDVKLSAGSLADGSYTQMLDRVYSDTLPYGDRLSAVGSLFGFGEGKMPLPDTEEPDAEQPPVDIPDEPVVTQPVVTEPAVTTTTEATTTEATTTEETTTQAEELKTYPAYANSSVNIRSLPSTDGERLGHLDVGDEILVVAMLENGWYEVIYNSGRAYAFGDYLTLSDEEIPPQATLPAEETTTAETDATEELPSTEYDIQVMYAIDVATIRLTPGNSGVNMGYFVTNDQVNVIHVGSDGWAQILFGSSIAYVRSDLLANEPVVTTVETEEEEPLPEVTQESTAVTSSPEEETDINSEDTASEVESSDGEADQTSDTADE